MNTKKICPVCGTENPAYEDWDAGCLGELDYTCKVCGYFKHICYSPAFEGITSDFPNKYEKEVKKLKLRVYDREELEQIF